MELQMWDLNVWHSNTFKLKGPQRNDFDGENDFDGVLYSFIVFQVNIKQIRLIHNDCIDEYDNIGDDDDCIRWKEEGGGGLKPQ